MIKNYNLLQLVVLIHFLFSTQHVPIDKFFLYERFQTNKCTYLSNYNNDNKTCIRTYVLTYNDKVFNFVEPDMWSLIKIVIPKIQAEWEDFAYSMQYDISAVNTIKEDCTNSAKRCRKLFEDWLTTPHGITPKTWHTLLERIREVTALQSAAEAIEEELKAAFTEH